MRIENKIKKYIDSICKSDNVIDRGYFLSKLAPIKRALICNINADSSILTKDFMETYSIHKVYFYKGECTNIDFKTDRVDIYEAETPGVTVVVNK